MQGRDEIQYHINSLHEKSDLVSHVINDAKGQSSHEVSSSKPSSVQVCLSTGGGTEYHINSEDASPQCSHGGLIRGGVHFVDISCCLRKGKG